MNDKPPRIKLAAFQEAQLLKDIEANGGKNKKGGFLSVWNSKPDFYGQAATPLRAAFIARRDRFIRLSLKNYLQELVDRAVPPSDTTYQKAKKKGILTGDFAEVVNKLYDETGQKQAEAEVDDGNSIRSDSSSSSSSDSSSGEESDSELSKSLASLSLKSSGKKLADNPPSTPKPDSTKLPSSAPPKIPTQAKKVTIDMSGEEGSGGGKCFTLIVDGHLTIVSI